MSTPLLHDAPPSPAEPAQRRPRGPGARALLWAGVAVGAVAIAQVAYQSADWLASTTTLSTESHAAAPVVELTADGDVTVTVGTSGSVDVERRARSGFQDVDYRAVESPERLVVEHTCPGWLSTGTCEADLTVQVPEGTSVVVHARSGEVRAEGIGGAVDVESSDGDVSVLRASGTVDARTSSGRVTVEGTGGAVTARTGDGGVTVRDAGGSVEARSSSGAVLVDGASGDVDARSGDGEVEAREVTGSAVATSSSGAVRVSGVAGDVEAVTGDGPVVVRGTGAPVALEISTGDGRSTVDAPTDPAASRTVTIRSSSGDVSYLGAE